MKVATLRCDAHEGWIDPFPGWDSPGTLIVAFGASRFPDSGPLDELLAAYPQSTVIGCSTAGEVIGDRIYDDSWVVAVAEFEGTRIRSTSAPVAAAAGSRDAGRTLAADLLEPDLAGVFVLSDGIEINGSELVRGLNSVLPPEVVTTGGLAGDGDRFERTWVLSDGLVRSGHVAAVGLYGDRVTIGHGSRGGWDMFGLERLVTRSDGNVLYELDGRPALALYKEYLGELADGLPATALLYPLSLRSQAHDREVVRTILSIDEQAESMTFAGDIPRGSYVQLMRANFDRVIGGAEGAAALAAQSGSPAGDVLAIAISCVGRRLVLGERTEEEVEATIDALPDGTAQVGFYSYGELSPYAVGDCELHNQTMTLTTIAERPAR